MAESETFGLRLLSLDGGGIRGLSTLLILRTILHRIQIKEDLKEMPRPCDYFDLIGGTSTGGIIALMLGRLRMSVDDAIRCYDELAGEVFSYVKMKKSEGIYRASLLEKAIKRIVEKNTGDSEAKLVEDGAPGGICKTFVCAMNTLNMNARRPVLFRTYMSSKEPPIEPCTVWEAARATSAAPTFFKRVSIGPSKRPEPYIDGGLGNNNPTAEVLEEAKVIFPDRIIACVISIGTGKPGTLNIPNPGFFERNVIPLGVIKLVIKMATDCEAMAEQMEKKFEHWPKTYFRFNVEQGLQKVKLGDWDRMNEVSAHTQAYMRMHEVDLRLDAAVEAIRERKGGIETVAISSIQGPRQHLTTLQPTEPAPFLLYKPVLPPPPRLMVGREKEKSEVIDTLLHKLPARIAILGGGGMGKTTLALSVLHEETVVAQYPSRYFISCEGTPSVQGLIGEIANALGIPSAKRDEHLIDTILSSFPERSLLCLDNLETIWDNEAARRDLEEYLLSQLQEQVKLGIIITMRGTLRPLCISWTKPYLPPLPSLTIDSARLIFKKTTSKPIDDFIEMLLAAVDGIPLAISLISAMLDEEHETSKSLWGRWAKAQSGVLENGGNDRLSNLDISIHLSVYGPRMRANPKAIDILAMLSVLPDGFSNDEKAREELESHLPKGYDLGKIFLTLRRASLIQAVEVTGAPHRLRMLYPIRAFCEQRLESPEDLRNSITAFYVKMMNGFPDTANPDGHAMIPHELHNASAVLIQAWREGRGSHVTAQASIEFTNWSVYVGNPVEDVICLAIQHTAGPQGLLGACHYRLGWVYLRRSQPDQAEASFERAAELYRQAHIVHDEASAVAALGEVNLMQHRVDKAEGFYKHAIELFQQVHDIHGEAHALDGVGRVYLRCSKLDDAQVFIQRAGELHRQVNVNGEARALNVSVLGTIYLRQGKLDEAEASLKAAIELFKQVRNVYGEAFSYALLGRAYSLRFKSRRDEAEALLKHAIELQKQVHHVAGEADTALYLGQLYNTYQEQDKAEVSFKHSNMLYKQVHDNRGEAQSLTYLAAVYLLQGKLDEAEASCKLADELNEDIVYNSDGKATNAYCLGVVYWQRSKLDEAEVSLKRAVELSRQTRSVGIEANALSLLRVIHLKQGKLNEAEALLERVSELHQQAQAGRFRYHLVDGGRFLAPAMDDPPPEQANPP